MTRKYKRKKVKTKISAKPKIDNTANDDLALAQKPKKGIKKILKDILIGDSPKNLPEIPPVKEIEEPYDADAIKDEKEEVTELRQEKDQISEDIKNLAEVYPDSEEALKLFYNRLILSRKKMIDEYGEIFVKNLFANIKHGVLVTERKKSQDYFAEMKFVAEGGSHHDDVDEILRFFAVPQKYFIDVTSQNPIRAKYEIFTIMERKLEGQQNTANDMVNPRLHSIKYWRDRYEIEESDEDINEFELVFTALEDAVDIAKMDVVKDALQVWPRMKAWYKVTRDYAFTTRGAIIIWAAIEANEASLLAKAVEARTKVEEETISAQAKLDQIREDTKVDTNSGVAAKKLLEEYQDQIKAITGPTGSLTRAQQDLDSARKDTDRIRADNKKEIEDARNRLERLEEQERELRLRLAQKIVTATEPKKSINNLEKPTTTEKNEGKTSSDSNRTDSKDSFDRVNEQKNQKGDEKDSERAEPSMATKGWSRIKGTDRAVRIEQDKKGWHAGARWDGRKWLYLSGGMKHDAFLDKKRLKELVDLKDETAPKTNGKGK